MPISTINQNGLNAPLTLTAPVFSGNVTANTVTSAAATALTLQSAGTTAVTINTSQNVGIGTSSPTANLDVSNATSGGLIGAFRSTGVNGGYIQFQASGSTPTTTGYIGAATRTNNSGTITDFGMTARTNLVFGTNDGTERMRIDSSGNVGIGTSSPSRRLMVEKSAGAVGFGSPYVQVGAANYANGGYYTIGFGYVGGSYTNAPAEIGAIATDDAGGGKVALTFATRDVTTNTAPTERMRVDSAGRLSINSSSNLDVSRLFVQMSSGDNAMSIRSYDSSSNVMMLQFYTAGNSRIGYIQTTGGTATVYSTTSDYRLKENIAPMTGALDKVALLKPCTYTWKSNGEDSQGFIAHELAEVVPDCVQGEKDAVDAEGNPVYQGIDTSFLVATLTAAIQELKAEFDAYKASHP